MQIQPMLLVGLLGLAAGTAALAQATSGQVTPGHVSSVESSHGNSIHDPVLQQIMDPNGDPNERICRIFPPPLGSRLSGRRTCATRAQWQASEQARPFDRRTIEVIQQQRGCDQFTGCGS